MKQFIPNIFSKKFRTIYGAIKFTSKDKLPIALLQKKIPLGRFLKSHEGEIPENMRGDLIKEIGNKRGAYVIETDDSVYLIGKTNRVICLDEKGKDKILVMLNSHKGTLDDLINEMNLLHRKSNAREFLDKV